MQVAGRLLQVPLSLAFRPIIRRYDRYWMGRTSWSDVIRNSRAFGRLIWFHVPPRFSGKTAEELQGGRLKRSTQELENAMAEKRMALDLIEG